MICGYSDKVMYRLVLFWSEILHTRYICIYLLHECKTLPHYAYMYIAYLVAIGGIIHCARVTIKYW